MKGSLLRKKQQSISFCAYSPLKLIIAPCFALCLLAAAYLSYSYALNLSQTDAASLIVPVPPSISSIWKNSKTLRGDNLLPTPWHPFTHSLTPSPARIMCTFNSCSSSTVDRLPPASSSSSGGGSSRSGSRSGSSRSSSEHECPDFFQWIHQDLSPWRQGGGITPQLLERAKEYAAFRVVISSGNLYLDLFYHCVQSRSLFTVWGLLLLLDRFPGQVPDVDFMFNCMDRPRFMKEKGGDKSEAPLPAPPPLLAYCGSQRSYDIPFPDWSYWGWAEVNIRPWHRESSDVFRGSADKPWTKRRATAQWKGNPFVGTQVRKDLLSCNATIPDAVEVYVQDWNAEAREGYKNSKLSKQCANRYKIYAEGHAWSVSFKYIMACGSTLLTINPEYHDFFMRALLPKYHYWPVNRDTLCPSIQAAVRWGNKHPKEAEAIGRQGQDFLRRELSMDHVYDYMLRLLQEYAKLQTFKPVVPPGAQLVCKESVLCMADAVQRKFLEQSLSKSSVAPAACRMPPASSKYLTDFKKREAEAFRAVGRIEIANNATTTLTTRSLIRKREKH